MKRITESSIKYRMLCGIVRENRSNNWYDGEKVSSTLIYPSRASHFLLWRTLEADPIAFVFDFTVCRVVSQHPFSSQGSDGNKSLMFLPTRCECNRTQRSFELIAKWNLVKISDFNKAAIPYATFTRFPSIRRTVYFFLLQLKMYEVYASVAKSPIIVNDSFSPVSVVLRSRCVKFLRWLMMMMVSADGRTSDEQLLYDQTSWEANFHFCTPSSATYRARGTIHATSTPFHLNHYHAMLKCGIFLLLRGRFNTLAVFSHSFTHSHDWYAR